MSKLNGRQKKALERLAKALQPPPVEELAAALTECFDAATERATEAAERAENAAERAQNAAERAEKAVARLETRMEARLDKQDDTLRLFWSHLPKKGKADQRLPIDD